MKHISSSVYYPQGNGQVEYTNKVFRKLLTKLVNENQNDWMNTCPHFYFLIKLLSKLELVTLHFNLFMDYTRYYLQSTYYHPS
jgi:hypothetical protein